MHFALQATAALWLVLLASCGKHTPPILSQAKCATEAECLQRLSDESNQQADMLGKACCVADAPPRRIAVVGNGIAGAAAALNLSLVRPEDAPAFKDKVDPRIRVFGSPSFWRNLDGLPAVWQHSLDAAFKAACLPDPKIFEKAGGGRIERPSVQVVNMEALLRAEADYLETGPVSISKTKAGHWLVVDAEGRRESVDTALIVATGLLRPLRFTDIVPSPASFAVRRTLHEASRVFSGDQFLSRAPDAKGKTVGVLGAGGNSADVIDHALSAAVGASQVVAWGELRGALPKTAAFKNFEQRVKGKLCRVPGFVTAVDYAASAVKVSSTASTCEGDGTAPPVPDLLVESLGRYEGDPPPEVLKAAAGKPITYKPVFDRPFENGGALIAVRVEIDHDTKATPMYLIGAAATWVPPGVEMSPEDFRRYGVALRRAVDQVNDPANPENPPPGFAVAAFMGSQLGRQLSGKLLSPCLPSVAAGGKGP